MEAIEREREKKNQVDASANGSEVEERASGKENQTFTSEFLNPLKNN